MIDRAFLQTAAERDTEASGSSLALSLPTIPVTIGLSGALGAGKTAFMRGFLRECGVMEGVTSPTYALEQRFATNHGEVLHIDLYRLNEGEARAFLHASDSHPGIRCIEWPEKAGHSLHTDIRVHIGELPNGYRSIEIACDDVSWPDDATIDQWRRELRLPANIGAHCDAVARFCERAADILIARGAFVRKQFLRAAGRTHDLLRFVDFRPEGAPMGHIDAPDDRAAWEAWKSTHPHALTHENAVLVFLTEQGFPELGHLVASHSIHLAPELRTTTEERLLYYADKRCMGEQTVSVAARYDDFSHRYGNGQRSEENLRWEREAMETEKLLFPDGAPL